MKQPLSDLQIEVLDILEKNSTKTLFVKETNLTNRQIYEQAVNKPNNPNYFTRALISLQKKGKVRIKSVYKTGFSGTFRTITIL